LLTRVQQHRVIHRPELLRGHFEFEGNFLGVEMVAAAVDHANGIALVQDADEAEAAFAARRLVNALAVGPAFDGRRLVEWRSGNHGNRRATARGVIRVATVVGGEHVGIAVNDAEAGDGILLDEIRDLAAFDGVKTPMIFRGREAGSAQKDAALIDWHGREISMVGIAAVVDWKGIVICAMSPQPWNRSDPENKWVFAFCGEQLRFEPAFLGGAKHGFCLGIRSGDGNAR